ncbi:MAG: type II secretion system protein [bacterium]
MKKKRGMTLAETLITLTIIGVVISIVFPIIINNSNDSKYKTLLKKQYSALSQATIYAANKNDGTLKGIEGYHWPLLSKLLPALNTIETCGDWNAFQNGYYPGCDPINNDADNECPVGGVQPYSFKIPNGGCWKDSKFLLLNKQEFHFAWPDMAGAVLSDGSNILVSHVKHNQCQYQWDEFFNGTYNKPLVCGTILLDVNGNAEPNMVGKDIYGFWVLSDKLVPFGQNDNYINTCNTDSGGYGCAAEYLKN